MCLQIVRAKSAGVDPLPTVNRSAVEWKCLGSLGYNDLFGVPHLVIGSYNVTTALRSFLKIWSVA